MTLSAHDDMHTWVLLTGKSEKNSRTVREPLAPLTDTSKFMVNSSQLTPALFLPCLHVRVHTYVCRYKRAKASVICVRICDKCKDHTDTRPSYLCDT